MRRTPTSSASLLAVLSIVLIAGLLVVATPLPALGQQVQQGTRIGFVRTERILRESNAAKAAQQKIERDFAKRDKELADMQNRLKSMTDRFDKEAAIMSDNDRGRRQREIAELDKDFQRRQREFREDLNQRRNEDLAVVLERANGAIKQIAEQENFDLILQEAVYVGPRIDITDRVVRALNASP
jgi:outer membrane protein